MSYHLHNNIMIRKLFFLETWTLAITTNYSNIENINQCDWHVLKPGYFQYFADPSIVKFDENDQTVEIIYESIRYFSGKGYLKKLNYSFKKNEISEEEIVLENKNHISFPNVYMHNDRQILLYENEEENALGIINYKDRDLSKLQDIKGQYLDPIIGEFNENIYLISSHRSESGLVFNIQLFDNNFRLQENHVNYIENKNCIRNGGKLIKEGDDIYRVGQLNNSRYGEGLVFNKLTQNIDGITEKEFSKLLPKDLNQKFTGLHSFSCNGNIGVVDIRIAKFNPIAVIVKLLRRLRKYGS